MTEHQVSSSQSQHRPPIITIDEPPSESTVTTPPLSTEPLTGGRDTPDVRDDESGRKYTENDETEQGVSEGRRTAKRNRRRVSNALKNDMEQYLEGYGENYGEQSSKFLDPLMEDFSVEIRGQRKRRGKKRRKKTKKSSSEGSSSPTKGTVNKQEPTKQPKKNVVLPSGLLGKDRNKQVEDEKIPLSKSRQRKGLHKSVKCMTYC